jgi:hypothetical protein
MNVSFLGTLLSTITTILSLAWRSNLLPPKVFGVVTVVSILAFWISLLAHVPDAWDRHFARVGDPVGQNVGHLVKTGNVQLADDNGRWRGDRHRGTARRLALA